MSTPTVPIKSTSFVPRLLHSLFQVVTNISPSLAGKLAFNIACIPMRRSQSDFTSLQLQPEQVDIAFNGGSLRTYTWGEGPTILGVHGWESNSGRFGNMVSPLVDAGFRVVLVDGHAHGASSGWQTNAILYGDATRAIIRHFGKIHAVIAHSFGGATTVAMLDRYPEIEIDRLVLIAPLTKMTDAFEIFKNTVDVPENTYKAMLNRVEKYTHRSLRTFDLDHLATYRTEHALIIQDEQDSITSFSGAKSVAEAWLNAKFYTTRGLGHRRILKDSGVIEQVVDFLK